MWIHYDDKSKGFNFGAGGVTKWEKSGTLSVILRGMPNSFWDSDAEEETSSQTTIKQISFGSETNRDEYVNQLIDNLGSTPIVTPS